MRQHRKIVFRADGNPKIGLGHLMRSLALADMLKDNFSCEFATRTNNDFIQAEIKKVCDNLHILPDKGEEHFDCFLEFLTGDEIVVLDNYFFTTEFQKQIMLKGCQLVCIDDLHDKFYVADVVINHSPGLLATDFSVAPYTRLCLGFDYALLRSPFLNDVEKKNRIKLSHPLICFGGADPENLTGKNLKSISDIEAINEISIVIGNAYMFEADLNLQISNLSNNCKINLYKNLSSESLVSLLKKVDFALVPCSTILLEVLSQNVPAISGYYVHNQELLAKRLKDLFNDVLIIGDLTKESLTERIIESLKNSIKNGSTSHNIDYRVTERFNKVFKSLDTEKQITLREAKIEDIRIYFDWANDKITRQNSLNSEQIPFKNHENWFNDKLNNGHSKLFIFEIKNKPIGQVRFEKEDDSAFINYSIDGNVRGKGIGFIILKMGIRELVESKVFEINKIYGVVKKTNIPSNKIFEQLNFDIVEEKDGNLLYCKNINCNY